MRSPTDYKQRTFTAGWGFKGGVHTTLKPMMMLYFSIFSALFSFFFLQPFELFLSIPFLHVVDPLQSACLPVNPPDPLPLLLLSFAIRAVSRHVRREIKLVGSSSKLTTNINTCSQRDVHLVYISSQLLKPLWSPIQVFRSQMI